MVIKEWYHYNSKLEEQCDTQQDRSLSNKEIARAIHETLIFL